MSPPRLDLLEPFILSETKFDKVPLFSGVRFHTHLKAAWVAFIFECISKPFDQEESFYGLNVVDKI